VPICISNPSTVRRNGTATGVVHQDVDLLRCVGEGSYRRQIREVQFADNRVGPDLGGYGVGLRGVTTGEDDVGPGFAQRSCDYLTQSAVRPRDDKCAAGLIDYVFCGPFGHAFQRTCLTRR